MVGRGKVDRRDDQRFAAARGLPRSRLAEKGSPDSLSIHLSAFCRPPLSHLLSLSLQKRKMIRTASNDVEAAAPPASPTADNLKLDKEAELDADDSDVDSLDTWAPEKQAAYWESA